MAVEKLGYGRAPGGADTIQRWIGEGCYATSYLWSDELLIARSFSRGREGQLWPKPQ
jgi:hypothetical protein